MSAKGEWNVGLSDHFTAPVARVVGEKYAKTIGALHCFLQVAHVDGAETLVRAVFVVNTNDGYLLTVALYREVVVSQKMPSKRVALQAVEAFHSIFSAESRVSAMPVYYKVVVAQYAYNTILCLDALQCFDVWFCFFDTETYQIASEAYEVWVLRIYGINKPL